MRFNLAVAENNLIELHSIKTRLTKIKDQHHATPLLELVI